MEKNIIKTLMTERSLNTFPSEHMNSVNDTCYVSIEPENVVTDKEMPALPLHIEAISDFGAWQRLESLWNEILRQSKNPHVYLTFEWLTTWWQCYQSSNKKLLILVASDGRNIYGIAPLMEVKKSMLGFRFTSIEFISMMKHAYSPYNLSGSLDFIILGRRQEVISGFMAYLAARKDEWQCMRLHPVSHDSESRDILKQESEKYNYRVTCRPVFSNACIDSSNSWEEYYGQRSSGFRKQHRTLKKKIELQTVVEISQHRSLKELSQGFNEIVNIERRSWKWKSGVAITSARYKDFYKKFFSEAEKFGWLRIGLLKIDGNPVGYDISVEFEGQVQSLKSSYDAAYQEYSPGTILTWNELEQYFREGIKKIDLLWGDLGYKLRWATRLHAHDEIFIYHDRPVSRVLFFLCQKMLLYRISRFATNKIEKIIWKFSLNSKTA